MRAMKFTSLAVLAAAALILPLHAMELPKGGSAHDQAVVKTSAPIEFKTTHPTPKWQSFQRTSWICSVTGSDMVTWCHVPNSDGIGAHCLCCIGNQCYHGTITDRS